jgi:hypothetical protein
LVDLAGAKARTQFGERISQGWRRLAAACSQSSVPWMLFATGDEPDIALAPAWRRRARRP